MLTRPLRVNIFQVFTPFSNIGEMWTQRKIQSHGRIIKRVSAFWYAPQKLDTFGGAFLCHVGKNLIQNTRYRKHTNDTSFFIPYSQIVIFWLPSNEIGYRFFTRIARYEIALKVASCSLVFLRFRTEKVGTQPVFFWYPTKPIFWR